ncbi:predicted protein [Chaetomium globosum CBS 148.51]|uniref:Zn(2)-C6 fungal-type domain-containing protein n=1 Tax=Chaetomium globosum (strain ATCC 6205 / CBS 148.51 / DSM 1962 / NBRC 6347 / NRRL 1970) TaxID=306901 RepID=Q2GPH8_CHAGB|nr:uncharacterized protein CHGG_10126 [Chaetomium globosum CBS 148.51]EAQ83722.1 predicted protein [Chaetomium globosum CBS 148.51]
MPRQNLTPNACNACKSRKIKCDGQQPCDKCALRKAACQYEARDARTKSELKAALNSLLSEREAGLSIIWDLVGHDQQRWEVIAARLQEDATAAGPSTSTSTSVARGEGIGSAARAANAGGAGGAATAGRVAGPGPVLVGKGKGKAVATTLGHLGRSATPVARSSGPSLLSGALHRSVLLGRPPPRVL